MSLVKLDPFNEHISLLLFDSNCECMCMAMIMMIAIHANNR